MTVVCGMCGILFCLVHGGRILSFSGDPAVLNIDSVLLRPGASNVAWLQLMGLIEAHG